MNRTRIDWQKTTLGDCFRIRHGYAFEGKYFSDSGPYVLLTPGNFHEQGGFRKKGDKEKYYTGEVPEDYVLKKGDLIVAMTEQGEGLLGSSAIVPDNEKFLHNQRLGLIEDLDERKVDKVFLYYLFNTRGVRHQIRASASGVKVRHTSPARIYEVKVDLPSVQSQRKIAAILSAYDDLIENNTRRIKILEEMAQAIYREWFVEFGAPSVELSKATPEEQKLTGKDKFPKGWELARLGEIAEEKRRGVQPSEIDQDTPYFGLEHLPRKSIALADWGYAGEVKSTKLAFKKREILFGKIRPYFHKVGVAPLDGVCSSDTIVIVPKQEEFFGLVLGCVSSEAFVNHATQTSQGTKMPRANWDVLVKYPVVKPDAETLTSFNELVGNIVDLIINVVFRSRNLRRTRDLLLPKLISGEVEVSQ